MRPISLREFHREESCPKPAGAALCLEHAGSGKHAIVSDTNKLPPPPNFPSCRWEDLFGIIVIIAAEAIFIGHRSKRMRTECYEQVSLGLVKYRQSSAGLMCSQPSEQLEKVLFLTDGALADGLASWVRWIHSLELSDRNRLRLGSEHTVLEHAASKVEASFIAAKSLVRWPEAVLSIADYFFNEFVV